MITRMWRAAAMATLGLLCTGALQAQSPAAEWSFLGAAAPDVASLVASPTDPDFLVARVDRNSALPVAHTLWMSYDGGTNWRPLEDAGFWYGRQVAFTSHGRGLAGDQGVLHVSEPDGLWWQPWVPASPWMVFQDVAVGAGDTVYVTGTELTGPVNPLGVYVVDLDGDQLHPRTPPLPAEHEAIKLLAADPVQAGVVVVVSDIVDSPWPEDPRLWVSTDGGQSWADRTGTMPSRELSRLSFTDTGWLATFTFDNTGGQPGVYRSLDHGHSWVALAPHLPDEASAAVQDPSDPQRLLVSGQQGLHLSEDGGFSWQFSVAGSAGHHFSSVQFAPDGGVFTTGFEGGLFHADASLQALQRIGPQLGAMATTAMAINAADPADAAAVGYGSFHSLVASDDGGLSWAVPQGAWPQHARQVAFGPDGRLYLAARNHNRSLLVREADGSWSGLMPHVGSISDLHSLAFGASAQHMLVSLRVAGGGSSQNEIRRTTDGGASWSVAYTSPLVSRDVSLVLNASGPAGGRYLALLADSVLHDPVLLRSSDGGQAWQPAGAGLPAGLRGAQLCTTGGAAPRAYLAARENHQQRLFRSDDDGASWQRTGWVPGWPGPHVGWVTALWCDPARAEVVVMGGEYGTVVRSTDGGESFELLGDDLGERTGRVDGFAASPAGLLYAATREGSWAVELPDDAPPVAPAEFAVSSSGPRARPTVTLAWTGGQPQVMVRRNGALLAVLANTGHFQDRPPPQAMPASYQVCNGDGSHCTAPGAAGH